MKDEKDRLLIHLSYFFLHPSESGATMSGRWLLGAMLPAGWLLAVAATDSRAQNTAEAPANRENIEAVLKLTQAAAAEYAIYVGDRDKPLELRREPVLRWSN